MAVYSMTGYASLQGQVAEHKLSIEIRSVNSRFLDLAFRLSDELRSLEPAMREMLAKNLKRGKVEVRAFVEQVHQTSIAQPSEGFLQQMAKIEKQVQMHLPNAAGLSTDAVLRLYQNLSREEEAESGAQSALQSACMESFQQGVAELKTARETEGARMVELLKNHITAIQLLARRATPMVPDLVKQQQAKFIERWNAALLIGEAGQNLTHINPDMARERALTEATAFAIRIDVAEELGRLDAHLSELDKLFDKGGELGKRLDFIIQELHREANTLGSKSASLELTHIAVDMKVLIEQMREQVQNIE